MMNWKEKLNDEIDFQSQALIGSDELIIYMSPLMRDYLLLEAGCDSVSGETVAMTIHKWHGHKVIITGDTDITGTFKVVFKTKSGEELYLLRE